jgi:hypothetical protein
MVSFKAPGGGLIIHCNDEPLYVAGARLQVHCEKRKYVDKADRWFGVCIRPQDGSLRFGINLEYKWRPSAEMDAKTLGLGITGRVANVATSGRVKFFV